MVRFRSKKSLKLFIVTLRLLGVLSVFFARKRAVVWEQRGPEVSRSRHVAHRLQFASPWPSLAGSHPERPQNCVASSAARRDGQRRTSHQIQACQKVPRWSGLPRQRAKAAMKQRTQAGLPTSRFMVINTQRESIHLFRPRNPFGAMPGLQQSSEKQKTYQPFSAGQHRFRDSRPPPSELPLHAAGIAPRVIPRKRQNWAHASKRSRRPARFVTHSRSCFPKR